MVRNVQTNGSGLGKLRTSRVQTLFTGVYAALLCMIRFTGRLLSITDRSAVVPRRCFLGMRNTRALAFFACWNGAIRKLPRLGHRFRSIPPSSPSKGWGLLNTKACLNVQRVRSALNYSAGSIASQYLTSLARCQRTFWMRQPSFDLVTRAHPCFINNSFWSVSAHRLVPNPPRSGRTRPSAPPQRYVHFKCPPARSRGFV